MQVGELLQVLWLEVVSPQNPEVLLDHVGPLFLDHEGPGDEVMVIGSSDFFLRSLDTLGFDPCLCGVVDATGQVAVSGNGRRRRNAVSERKDLVDEAHGLSCRRWSPTTAVVTVNNVYRA